MSSHARWLHRVGLLLGLIGLAAFVRLAIQQHAWEAMRDLPSGLWLVIPLGALPLLLHTRSFAYAFPRLEGSRTPRFGALFVIRLAGEAINNGLASAYVAGEPIKAVLAARRGASAVGGLAAALVGKTTFLFGEVCFLVLGVGGALAWFDAGSPIVAVLCWVSAGGLAFIALFVVLQKRRLVGRAARVLSFVRLGPKSLWERALPGADAVDAAVRGYHSSQRRDFWRSTVWATLGWTLGSLEVYLFLRFATAVEHPLLFALALEAWIAVVKGLAFAVPGGIGVQEGGILWMFETAGLGSEAGIAYAMLRRTREWVWVALGFLCLLIQLRRPADAELPLTA